MSRFCSCFFYFLDYADIFRFPLTLTFNKLEKTSTYTGKLTTLCIIIFLMYSFIVSDLVNKKNAQTLNQDLIQLKRPSMLLSKQNFTMALGIADSNNVFIIDETVFSFIFYIYHYNSTSQIVNQTTYILQPCNQKNFIENPNEFSTLGLTGTFCLPIDEVKLGGYWDEEIIDYFWIELRTCQNSSSSNITCKSSEEINFMLKNNFIDIYMTNHNIDSANYGSPISRNLKILYQRIDSALLKSINLYMKQSNIETDDGFFFENLKIIESFLQGDIENDITFIQNTDNLLYVMNIYSSNLQTTVVRKYQKIQTLLAQLGGICNFLFLFGFLLSKFENHYNLISFISNELYIFPKIDKKKPKAKADSIINSGSANSLSPANKKNWQDRLKSVLKVKHFSKKSIGMTSSENLMIPQNLEHYQKLKQKENFFSVGFGCFLKLLFKKQINCIFKKLNKKERLFEKSENQIADELDILNILKKLHDIEKLKRILLSEEQLYCFNLLSKPMIIPENVNLRRLSKNHVIEDKRFKFSVKNNKYFEKQKLREIYENLKERSQGSKIDKRIIKLLDEDVKCFLNNENFTQ